jgi:hypothetical protein
MTEGIYELEPGDNARLEPLGKYVAGRGMDSASRSIFDVLYEAGEPLDRQTIGDRTFDRASSAAQYHARRAMARQRQPRIPRTHESRSLVRNVPLRDDWRSWVNRLILEMARRGTLLRDEEGRYRPNPDKPPRAARVDGGVYPYTREAWLETTAEERTVGEVHTMKMQVERFLGGRSRDELLLVLEVFVDDLAGFGKDKRRPLDPRTVRAQLRWLLERPTTDESRAWLLNELARRIFDLSPR